MSDVLDFLKRAAEEEDAFWEATQANHQVLLDAARARAHSFNPTTDRCSKCGIARWHIDELGKQPPCR